MKLRAVLIAVLRYSGYICYSSLVYNLEFNRTSNRHTREQLFENIKNVWDFKGKQPTLKDMQIYPSNVCFQTYYNRFGSWKMALAEFVKQGKGSIKPAEQSPFRRSRKTLNNGLRYDVMKRDRFKCAYCGKSPATSHGVELEIDHVVPISSGGDNAIENLKTACRKCNQGKMNKA